MSHYDAALSGCKFQESPIILAADFHKILCPHDVKRGLRAELRE